MVRAIDSRGRAVRRYEITKNVWEHIYRLSGENYCSAKAGGLLEQLRKAIYNPMPEPRSLEQLRAAAFVLKSQKTDPFDLRELKEALRMAINRAAKPRKEDQPDYRCSVRSRPPEEQDPPRKHDLLWDARNPDKSDEEDSEDLNSEERQ